MKYEEHVLPNGNWSRPQVPFIEFEGFSALKDYLHEGIKFDYSIDLIFNPETRSKELPQIPPAGRGLRGTGRP